MLQIWLFNEKGNGMMSEEMEGKIMEGGLYEGFFFLIRPNVTEVLWMKHTCFQCLRYT